MKTKTKNIAIGVGIGSTINLLMLALGGGHYQSSIDTYRVLLMSALIGYISNIFSHKKLSLLTQTLIQLVGTLILVLITGYFNRWYDASSLISVGIFIGIFISIFLILWTLIYYYYKNEFHKINETLQKRKQ